MKGILLAGGRATRLYPITKGVCKQLLPIYDKPMIYYPLSVLMLSGIKDILLISTEKDIDRFNDLLGNGNDLGINICYKAQKKPNGIAEAFLIGEEFIGDDSVSLILGDNIFYGHYLTNFLQKSALLKEGAINFAYYVNDPNRYGIVEFDKDYKVISIKEKPKKAVSNWAITGLYFYDKKVVEFAKTLKMSKRGELEITDINKKYLKIKELKVELLGRGYAWLDTGTYDSLIDASSFIRTLETRQGLKVGCIEEVAFRMGYIDKIQLAKLANNIKTSYGEYLFRVINN